MKTFAKNLKIKSSYVLRLTSVAIMLAFITPLIINAQGGKVNFSGTWNMNADKSIFGEGGGQRMGTGNLVATQEENLLTVVRTRTGQDGQSFTITMKYNLDGKESLNSGPRGDSKSITGWSPDGKNLTIITTRTWENNGQSREMKSTEEWSLTDAKTLTIKSTREGQNGEVKMTIVYDKQ
jgi:hypothetical protein